MEKEGTEEEAVGIIEKAIGMEIEEEGKGEKGGDGTLRALVAIEFLIQEVDLIGTKLADSYNGFNELSRLEIMWTVRHLWLAGAIFVLNFYSHWAQLLIRQTGDPLVTILIREGVTQGDLLSIVLYRINLVPLVEDLRAPDPGLVSLFYMDDAAFDGLTRQSAQL